MLDCRKIEPEENDLLSNAETYIIFVQRRSAPLQHLFRIPCSPFVRFPLQTVVLKILTAASTARCLPPTVPVFWHLGLQLDEGERGRERENFPPCLLLSGKTHSHTKTLSLSLSLSLKHTHTHTHALKPTRCICFSLASPFCPFCCFLVVTLPFQDKSDFRFLGEKCFQELSCNDFRPACASYGRKAFLPPLLSLSLSLSLRLTLWLRDGGIGRAHNALF